MQMEAVVFPVGQVVFGNSGNMKLNGYCTCTCTMQPGLSDKPVVEFAVQVATAGLGVSDGQVGVTITEFGSIPTPVARL